MIRCPVCDCNDLFFYKNGSEFICRGCGGHFELVDDKWVML